MLKKAKTYFKNRLRGAYLLLGVFWSYFSGTAWYFILLKKNNNSLDEFIDQNILRTSFVSFITIFGGYFLISMALIWIFRKIIKKQIFLFSILPALVLLGMNISNNGPIEKFINLIIISAVSTIFIYLTFLFPLINKLKKYPKLVVLPFALFLLAYLCLSLFRHYNLQSHAFDLGIFNQALFKFSHFEFDNTIRKVPNLWGDHLHLILFPLSFLHKIIPSSSLLLVIQAAVVVIGGAPLYLLGSGILKSRASSLLITCAYFSFYGLALAINFDFHEITIAASFFLFTFYFAWKEKWGWYFIMLFLFLSCKEDVAIIVVFMGIFLGFLKHNWKIGILTSFIGLGWFLAVTKILMPRLSPEGFIYFDYILGSSPLEAVKNVILNPLFAFHGLINEPEKIRTVLAFFASFGFLPILAPTFFFLAMPALGENLWHVSPSRWGEFHYEAIAAPIFALSAIYAIYNIAEAFNKKVQYKVKIVLAVFVLISAFVVSCEMRSPLLRILKPSYYQITPESKQTFEAIKVIPEDSSVTALATIVPHLAFREKIYDFPGCDMEVCTKSDYFVLTLGGAQWAMTKEAMKEEVRQFLDGKEFRSDYGLFNQNGAAFVFKRGYRADEEAKKRAYEYLNSYEFK